MSRSSRDPNLEGLASAVNQVRRTKRRPRAASNGGPVVAVIIVVAIVAGASGLMFWNARARNPNPLVAAHPHVPQPPVERDAREVKPIQAVSNPQTTAAAEEQSVVVTIISAQVGPIELFPVKKAEQAVPTTAPSKLFGRIPDAEDQPRTSDPLLAIRVRIQNKSGAAIDYRTWNRSAPVLADDGGNVYAFCQFNDYRPKGRIENSVAVNPDQSVEDLLIFERPPATIRSLDLRLPGRNIGTSEAILISISPSQMSGL